MNLHKKLTTVGLGLAFVLTLAVADAYAQRSRYWGDRQYSRRGYDGYRESYGRYGRYQGSRYGRYAGSRYGSYGRRGGYLTWGERRRLQRQRYRAIRAQQRYYRTRARILNRANRRSYYNRGYYTYRNW